jgi:hypothetical protein
MKTIVAYRLLLVLLHMYDIVKKELRRKLMNKEDDTNAQWNFIRTVLQEQKGLYARIVRNNFDAYQRLVTENPYGKILFVNSKPGQDWGDSTAVLAVTEQCGCLDVHFCLEPSRDNPNLQIFTASALKALVVHAREFNPAYVLFTVPKRPHFMGLNNSLGLLASGTALRLLESGHEMKGYSVPLESVHRIL